MRRVLAAAVYYAVAQYLPLSHRPGGPVFKTIRGFLVRQMAASCGTNVNVEARVDIGLGRSLKMGRDSGIGTRSRVEAAEIGDGVIMAPEVMILARNHRRDQPGVWIGRQGMEDVRPPIIGEGSWIGARAIILPGVTIGKFAVIGAGAVVSKDVPDYAVAVGNPARVVRYWGEHERD